MLEDGTEKSMARMDAIASDIAHAVLAEIMHDYRLVTIEDYDALTGADDE